MVKPARHPPADFQHGEGLRSLHANLARALDQSPDEVQLLHGELIKIIHRHPNARNLGPQELIDAVYHPATDAFNASNDCRIALESIARKYQALPATASATLQASEDQPDMVPILILIAIGLVAGAIIVGGVCIYIAAVY